MKKLALLICTYLNVIITEAQPVLNSTCIPPLGSIITYTDVDTTGINEGSSGTNQVWNFSNSVPSGLIEWSEFISPINSPVGNLFPMSNTLIKEYDNTGFIDTASIFVKSTNDSLIQYGVDIEGTTAIYNKGVTRLTFPFNYNDAITDSASYVIYDSSAFPYVFKYSSSTNYTISYDGYGTLITPSGTFNNALRTKSFIREEYLVEDFLNGVVIYSESGEDRTTSYDWFSTTANQYYRQFSISYDTLLSSAVGNEYLKFASYQSSLTLSANNLENKPGLLSIYPVPSRDIIYVKTQNLNQELNCSVYNSLGGLVKGNLEINRAGFSKIDISAFREGVYFIRLIDKNGNNYIEKFIKAE